MFRRKKTETDDLAIKPLHKLITLGLIGFFAYAVVTEKNKLPPTYVMNMTIDNITSGKQAKIEADFGKEIELQLTAEDAKNLAKLAEKEPNIVVFKIKIEQTIAAPAPAAPTQNTNTTATP
jgi:hypothetical protein